MCVCVCFHHNRQHTFANFGFEFVHVVSSFMYKGNIANNGNPYFEHKCHYHTKKYQLWMWDVHSKIGGTIVIQSHIGCVEIKCKCLHFVLIFMNGRQYCFYWFLWVWNSCLYHTRKWFAKSHSPSMTVGPFECAALCYPLPFRCLFSRLTALVDAVKYMHVVIDITINCIWWMWYFFSILLLGSCLIIKLAFCL